MSRLSTPRLITAPSGNVLKETANICGKIKENVSDDIKRLELNISGIQRGRETDGW